MQTKAEDVKAPFGDGVANTDAAKFTLSAVSAAGLIPVGWYGMFIEIRPVGANMVSWFFSTLSTATATNAASDANGSQSAGRGGYIPNGEMRSYQVPFKDNGAQIFLVRLGDGAGDVYISKASGTPGNNTNNGT